MGMDSEVRSFLNKKGSISKGDRYGRRPPRKSPRPLWERSDRIGRCDPGEGFVSTSWFLRARRDPLIRRHSRCEASAALVLRTAAKGRLRHLLPHPPSLKLRPAGGGEG